jgi:hypothetical protein
VALHYSFVAFVVGELFVICGLFEEAAEAGEHVEGEELNGFGFLGGGVVDR